VVYTLSVDDVLAIHNRVVSDFADDDDPVGFAGPRDEGRLLESVVARQEVGLGDVLKYPDAWSSAATLTFGICCGHPFHNGDKRTALVAMLAHLERNELTIAGVRLEGPLRDDQGRRGARLRCPAGSAETKP
jgi:death-on-curing protein